MIPDKEISLDSLNSIFKFVVKQLVFCILNNWYIYAVQNQHWLSWEILVTDSIRFAVVFHFQQNVIEDEEDEFNQRQCTETKSQSDRTPDCTCKWNVYR